MTRCWKPALLGLLAGSILVQGCTGTSFERIKAQHASVRRGSTKDDVRRGVGAPGKVYTIHPAVSDETVEIWRYTLVTSKGTEAAMVIVGVVLIVLLLVVLAAAGGGGNFGGMGGSSGNTQWRFFVGFGADGRVRGVSSLEPLK